MLQIYIIVINEIGEHIFVVLPMKIEVHFARITLPYLFTIVHSPYSTSLIKFLICIYCTTEIDKFSSKMEYNKNK